MDSFRSALDAHIKGLNVKDSAVVLMGCPNGHEIAATSMYFELGGWFYSDEETATCTACGAEMEELPKP